MSVAPDRLHPDDLELLAARTAEHLAVLLGGSPTESSPSAGVGKLVDAAAVAQALGVSRQTVYANAAELGGKRIGKGPRARWRFSLETAQEGMRCLSSSAPGPENASGGKGSDVTPTRRRRHLPNGLPPAGSVLVVRGRVAVTDRPVREQGKRAERAGGEAA